MLDPDEIARFRDRCSVFMGELLDELATTPGMSRTFPRSRTRSVGRGGAWRRCSAACRTCATTSSADGGPTASSAITSPLQGAGRSGRTLLRRVPCALRARADIAPAADQAPGTWVASIREEAVGQPPEVPAAQRDAIPGRVAEHRGLGAPRSPPSRRYSSPRRRRTAARRYGARHASMYSCG